ncbi:hypothetical protein Heal19_500082 (plasmid) [Lactiplantibacillus plantarum]|nr:hypothetical protein Heal19_500082 [Lactiplantibacillus plantarum]
MCYSSIFIFETIKIKQSSFVVNEPVIFDQFIKMPIEAW